MKAFSRKFYEERLAAANESYAHQAALRTAEHKQHQEEMAKLREQLRLRELEMRVRIVDALAHLAESAAKVAVPGSF